MASTLGATFDARYDQMFPVLDAAEIGRLRRFSERRGFRAGERLVATGEVSPGMFVIVSGEVELSQHSVQLLGRPTDVDHDPVGVQIRASECDIHDVCRAVQTLRGPEPLATEAVGNHHVIADGDAEHNQSPS